LKNAEKKKRHLLIGENLSLNYAQKGEEAKTIPIVIKCVLRKEEDPGETIERLTLEINFRKKGSTRTWECSLRRM